MGSLTFSAAQKSFWGTECQCRILGIEAEEELPVPKIIRMAGMILPLGILAGFILGTGIGAGNRRWVTGSPRPGGDARILSFREFPSMDGAMCELVSASATMSL